MHSLCKVWTHQPPEFPKAALGLFLERSTNLIVLVTSTVKCSCSCTISWRCPVRGRSVRYPHLFLKIGPTCSYSFSELRPWWRAPFALVFLKLFDFSKLLPAGLPILCRCCYSFLYLPCCLALRNCVGCSKPHLMQRKIVIKYVTNLYLLGCSLVGNVV